MSSFVRHLLVLFSFFLAAPIGADDKPPAKPGDARQAALVKAGYTAIPLTLDPHWLTYYANGAVGPEKTKFFINSGTPDTILDLKLAKKLELELGEPGLVGGLGGGMVCRPTFAPGLVIGSYDTRKDWPNMNALAGDLSGWPGAPGCVLGTDVLDSWESIIDTPSRILYLRPPLTNAWPKLARTWTVTSWQEEGSLRKLDPKSPTTFTFADRRLKLTAGGKTREYAVRFNPNDAGDLLLLFDAKRDGALSIADVMGGGLIKMKDGVMTLCLLLETDKPRDFPSEFAAPKGSGYVLLELKSTAPEARKLPTDALRELLLKEGYTAAPLDREPGGTRMATARVGRYDLRLLVDTGSSLSAFDAAGLGKWGALRLGKLDVGGLGDNVRAEKYRLREMTFGKYDTRRAWAAVNGGGIDMTGLNQLRVEQKRQTIQGMLGNFDLLNGSAVIDFGTNTLYLRTIKETLWPQLEGKWVGVRYESDGRKGQYAPGEGTVEFKSGRIRFASKNGVSEHGFHLRDMGDRYRFGLFDSGADEMADGFKYASGGLLKLVDGKLTIVMEQGQKEANEFAAPKGSSLLLVEYERAK